MTHAQAASSATWPLSWWTVDCIQIVYRRFILWSNCLCACIVYCMCALVMSLLGHVLFTFKQAKGEREGREEGRRSWRSAKNSIGSQWIVKRLTEGRRERQKGAEEHGETNGVSEVAPNRERERKEDIYNAVERVIWIASCNTLSTHSNEIQLLPFSFVILRKPDEFTGEWSVFVSSVVCICLRLMFVCVCAQVVWFHITYPCQAPSSQVLGAYCRASRCGQPRWDRHDELQVIDLGLLSYSHTAHTKPATPRIKTDEKLPFDIGYATRTLFCWNLNNKDPHPHPHPHKLGSLLAILLYRTIL